MTRQGLLENARGARSARRPLPAAEREPLLGDGMREALVVITAARLDAARDRAAVTAAQPLPTRAPLAAGDRVRYAARFVAGVACVAVPEVHARAGSIVSAEGGGRTVRVAWDDAAAPRLVLRRHLVRVGDLEVPDAAR